MNYIGVLFQSFTPLKFTFIATCDYRAKAQLGSCVRVADDVNQTLHKAILLFSLFALAFEDLSEP